MNKSTDIQSIIDKYETLKEKRLPKLIDFSEGRCPYLVSIEAGFTRYSCCNSIEQNFNANIFDFEKTLDCPSDTLPNLEPWFGTGIFAEAFGCKYFSRESECPAVYYAYHSIDEIRKIQKPKISDGIFFKMVLEAIDYFKDKTNGRLPICITDTQSASDTASLILDASEFFIACYTHPEVVKRFLNIINELIIEFSQKQVELIGDCLVLPGRILSSSINANHGGKGITIADDNLAVSSPKLNAEYFLPLDDKLGEVFGGVAIHSCGNWGHTMPLLLQMKNLTMVDCKISSSLDPTPTAPEDIRDALKGTNIAVQVTLKNDVESDFDLLDRICSPDLRLIARFLNLNDGADDIQSTYDKVKQLLQKKYGC
jgi:hypothetical protein